MEEFKGTPGPWKYTIRNVNEMMTTFHGVVMGDTYIEIATRNEREDAQLISAAPELLEALQELVHADIHGIKNCSAQVNALEKAKSAIAKALGK
ncbi:hypothetical protein R1Z32_003794 [Citrobacter freundii]|nr:hypothetical protein [Citrobacter freundii]